MVAEKARAGKREAFRERVYAAVRAIPRGQVRTYAQIARAAGSPRACRAVGNILRRNADSSVPCHRVVRSDGSLGDFNRGAAEKRRMLSREGYSPAQKHNI